MMAVTELAWVLEQPGKRSKNESSLYNENGLRSRRFHHKSRTGCKSCKQRRVKCDEGVPDCSQCRDRNVKCEYLPSPPPSSEHSIPRSTEPNKAGITSDPAVGGRIMQVLIESNAPCVQLESTAMYKRNHALEVIDHFAACQESWLGSPTCQRILQEHAVRLALNAGHLVHAIIAISAAHLAAVQTTADERKKYWIASTLHYHHSLGMYSSAIVHDLQDEDADAVFASGILHAMLAFVKTPTASEEVPLVDDRGPTWIMSMQGIRSLLDFPDLRKRLEKGIWVPLIQEFDRWQNASKVGLAYPGSQLGPTIINALKDLYNEEYMSPFAPETESQLAMLDMLFCLDITNNAIDGFMGFIINATPACIARLRAKDDKALLVVAYWCALFGQIDQWWISSSAKIECNRICAHLEQSRDNRIRYLLDFPASTSGYELKNRTPT